MKHEKTAGECCPQLRLALGLFALKSTVYRALRVALIVGVVLNLINFFPVLIRLEFGQINAWSFGLAFVVPYLVSSYSAFVFHSRFSPGDVSPVDAMLHCNNCKQVDFHVWTGDEVSECPGCGDHTDWKVKQVNTKPASAKDMIKSLALFARHNPQPLFRVDKNGIITGANPAANIFFNRDDMVGQNIYEVFHDFPNISVIREMIASGTTFTNTVNSGKRTYYLHIRGVSSIHTLNVYCNEITQIVEAEQKIREQARDIDASIKYARRIQLAMLPGQERLDDLLNECFVFFRPQNVVSGDFYWVNKVDEKVVAAVGDCTGHGVPGAVMSILGMSLLNEIVLREKELSPAKILERLRERLIASLSQGSSRGKVEDGLDIALIVFEPDGKQLTFAGAYNALYIFRVKELTELKGDRMPVGNFMHEPQLFSEKRFEVRPGDRLYLFSDGFKDQFGGPRDKKFSSRSFRSLLTEFDGMSCDDQKKELNRSFENWKGSKSQVDDVTVLGMLVE